MTATPEEFCLIPENDQVFQRYHDEEWGVPVVCDRAIFEKVCLEGFQSGLSWQTILHRRDALRQAFDDFSPALLARYSDSDVQRLMGNSRIIRNRRKILSVINNAKQYAKLQAEFGTLAAFFWSFEPGSVKRPALVNRRWLETHNTTPESTALSNALKARGWSYIGPTNMYALMQALGIVNDHVAGCKRRAEIEQLRKSLIRPVSD